MWLRGTFRLCDVWLIPASLGGSDHSASRAVIFLLWCLAALPRLLLPPCCLAVVKQVKCKEKKKKKSTTQHPPKNSLWAETKDFLMPREGEPPVHASLACSQKCCSGTFCGAFTHSASLTSWLQELEELEPAASATDLVHLHFLTNPPDRMIFFRKKRNTGGFWGWLIISASADFPRGSAAELLRMNWFKVSKESNTHTPTHRWLKTNLSELSCFVLFCLHPF